MAGTRWIGRFFPRLEDRDEVPQWMRHDYEREWGRPWEFRGGGFVLVRDDAACEVLQVGHHVATRGLTLERERPIDRLLESSHDGVAYPFWFDVVTLEGGSTALASYEWHLKPEGRKRLEARGLYWRKKKEYAQALHYLKLLTRDPACGFPIRLELAACGLKVSTQDASAEARSSDPCLQQYVKLCQQDDAGVLEHIEGSKWLEPEDLYYLGFHFTEKEGQPRRFGSQVLKLVVKRSPKSKTGQAAKTKLKVAGV